ncbi:DUF2586 family protein [Hymenobacter terrenus]|uniref:DUF2586 family protein n=1 Tax=Hymenobacter terrenus TaxID=1629124 RepID=UPI000697B344|nr:DUF2586 family protein [Hymenobacter terrenus]
MSLFDVTFLQTDGGLGRVLAGDDAISAIVYQGEPTALLQNGAVIFSSADADNLNITSATADTAPLRFAIDRFFEQVSAPLYLAIVTQESDAAAALETIQNAADGAVRQVLYVGGTFSVANVNTLQAAAASQYALHRGLSVIYAPDSLGTFMLATLPTLVTGSAQYVSVVLGTDYLSSQSQGGATLGTIAKSKVSDCIGWVRQYNVSGTFFDRLGFVGGEDYKNVTMAQLKAIKDKGYIFLRKYTGFSGSFHSDSQTATLGSSDYATIENVRTMDKAQRLVRAALVPELGSPLRLKGGKLSEQTLAKFELLVTNPLTAMVDAQELSEFSVFINPAQNVLSTSTLEIQLGLTPLSVARQITVPIGFQVKASN